MALLAAIWLLLQTVAGFAAGASFSSVQLDAFGNPLCTTSQQHDNGEAPASTDHKVPACCALACGWSTASAVPAPSAAVLEAPLATAIYTSVDIALLVAGRALERLPAKPRAPPAA